MPEKLVRVTFDAVKGTETKNGVCYYRSNDGAQKESIVRRSQIVQEVELGEASSKAAATARLKRARSNLNYFYSFGPDSEHYGYMQEQAGRTEDLIAHLESVVDNLDAQNEMIADERYEYGIMFIHHPDDLHRGPMTRQEAQEWMRGWLEDCGPDVDPEVFYMVRRPIGEWEKF